MDTTADATPLLSPGPIVNRPLDPADVGAVSRLHAEVFGPGRFARTAYRVREGTQHVSRFCRGAFLDGALIACLRLTPVIIGTGRPHLLLGPLAVTPEHAGKGFGKALVTEALDDAGAAGVASVVLVGDLSYYDRFHFARVLPGQISFPGPVNPARILIRALRPGAELNTKGLVVPDFAAFPDQQPAA